MKRFLLCLYLISISLGLIAQSLQVSTGSIKHFEKFAADKGYQRNISVWLPDGYSTKKKYAVLYMHDGQMLFDSTKTWNHQEWKVDEVVGKLLKKHQIKDCIVVGIWNIPETRRIDYFPSKAFKNLSEADQRKILSEKDPSGKLYYPQTPRSDDYLRYIVRIVKPFIDSSFATDPGQSSTFIAGSSMGGLISMYAICEYPHVFGGAACLSTHWTGIFRAIDNPMPDALLKYLDENLPDPAYHRIYFDYGSATLDSLYAPFQKKADKIMRKHQYKQDKWETKYFAGADHSEKAWAARLDIPLRFLLRRSQR